MRAIDPATGNDVPLLAAGGVLQVGGNPATAAVVITRPGNTTPYAANDAVADSASAPTVLTFASLARTNAGAGVITTARIVTNLSTCTSKFRLHLFNVLPTPINDNAVYTELWANRVGSLGFIDFVAMTTSGTGSDAAISINSSSNLAFTAAAGTKNIYGLLEIQDILVPASAQVFYIALSANNA